MEKTENLKEIGLKEYRMWRQGNLRGHRIIGQWIINRYRLLKEDLDILEKEKSKYYSRGHRKRIKLAKEIERGTK